MTSAELAAIYKRVAGPRNQLFLPSVPQNRRVTGAEFIVPPTYSDMAGTPSSANDLHKDLVAANCIETVYRLAGLNILLESRPDLGLEQEAIEHYIRPEFRSGLPVDPSKPQPTYSFIFNRVGVLIALKGILGAGSLASAGPASEHYIGDLILRANESVSDKRFQNLTSPPTELELASELIPTWDLTNTRDLAYGMSRMYRMIEHLGGTDPQVAALRAKLGISSSNLRFGGLPLDEFLAVAFGLYTYAKSIPPSVLLKDSSATAFDSNRVLEEVNFPPLLLEKFLAKTSLPLAEFRDRLTKGEPWTQDRYADLMNQQGFTHDFLSLRQHPILSAETHSYVILDLQFLAELLFSGLFFELLFGFPPNLREDFLSLWGRIFELSLFELLQHFYPPSAGIVQIDVPFEGGQIDALLDFGDAILIFEFKHFLLPHEVKYGRDAKRLEKELKKKLFSNQEGKQKAIRQLASEAKAIRQGRIATLLGRADSLPRKAAIYPVVVVPDASLEAPLVNTYLNELFLGETDGLDVKPLTLMSVEELEETIPIIAAGGMTWPELFETRFEDKRVYPFSVGQARYDLAREKGTPYTRNQYRLDQFAEIFAQIRKLYKGRKDAE